MSLPAGKYLARPADWGVGDSGKPYVAVLFVVSAGNHKGEAVQWSGWFDTEKVDKRGMTARDRTFDVLDMCGVLSEPRTVIIDVEIDERNGTKYSRVRFVNPLAVRVKNQMSREDGRTFLAQQRKEHEEGPGDAQLPPWERGDG